MLDSQIGDLERRIESVIAKEETSAAKARLLRSFPGIGPVSTAMLIADMPELGRMTSGETAAMTGLAPVPHDSGTMRGKRALGGGRRALRRVLFHAALAAACHNRVLKPVVQRLKMRGTPRNFVIVAIAPDRSPLQTQSSIRAFFGNATPSHKLSCWDTARAW